MLYFNKWINVTWYKYSRQDPFFYFCRWGECLNHKFRISWAAKNVLCSKWSIKCLQAQNLSGLGIGVSVWLWDTHKRSESYPCREVTCWSSCRLPIAVTSCMTISCALAIVTFFFEGVMYKFKQIWFTLSKTPNLVFIWNSHSSCRSKTAHYCLTMSLWALKPRNPMWTWVSCIIGFWVVHSLVCMSQKCSCETFSRNRQTWKFCVNIYIFHSLKTYSTFEYYLGWKYRSYFL